MYLFLIITCLFIQFIIDYFIILQAYLMDAISVYEVGSLSKWLEPFPIIFPFFTIQVKWSTVTCN